MSFSSLKPMMHAKAATTTPESDDQHGPSASGTRKVARPLDVLCDPIAVEAGESDERERAARPTVRVPRYEAKEPTQGEDGFYANVLDIGGGKPGARAEAPTIPAPPRVEALRGTSEESLGSQLSTRAPPSFGELQSLQGVPRLTCRLDRLHGTVLDHKQAFVLILVDGHLDIETILDATPMPMHEVLRILLELIAKGLIAVD